MLLELVQHPSAHPKSSHKLVLRLMVTGKCCDNNFWLTLEYVMGKMCFVSLWQIWVPERDEFKMKLFCFGSQLDGSRFNLMYFMIWYGAMHPHLSGCCYV